MSSNVKVATTTTKKRKYNKLPKYAFTYNLLSNKDGCRFDKLFLKYFRDVLEGTYKVISSCDEYCEYLLFIEDMIECFEYEDFNENYKSSISFYDKLDCEDVKQTKEYKDFLKILYKLDKICDKRKIGRLFYVIN